jgi:hypothetical protein
LVYGIESIGPQFRVVNHVFVSLVEDEMQDAFSLDLASAVSLPDLDGCQLLLAILGLKFWDDDQFLQCVVEVLLVVVERRVFAFFYFLLLFTDGLLLRFLYFFN